MRQISRLEAILDLRSTNFKPILLHRNYAQLRSQSIIEQELTEATEKEQAKNFMERFQYQNTACHPTTEIPNLRLLRALLFRFLVFLQRFSPYQHVRLKFSTPNRSGTVLASRYGPRIALSLVGDGLLATVGFAQTIFNRTAIGDFRHRIQVTVTTNL